MDLILRIFGSQLVISLGPADPVEDATVALTTADHSFGFAGVPEYYFTDDEE
jgi:YHS domain-containing protein